MATSSTHLSTQQNGSFTVDLVPTRGRGYITVEISSDATVLKVKERAAAAFNVPTYSISNLFYAGQVLRDDQHVYSLMGTDRRPQVFVAFTFKGQ